MRAAVVVLLLAALAGPVGAAHITDKLVVGLYADQKLTGKPKQLLTSGAPIEVLKRGKGVVQVRVADDTRGWIESRYVSEEKPAAMKLLEVQAELRRLKEQLKSGDSKKVSPAAGALPSVADAKAEQALEQAQKEIKELQTQLADLPRLQAAAAERDELKGRLAELRDLLGVKAVVGDGGKGQEEDLWERYRPWLVAVLLALLGFIAGVAYIDYRIRKRYGGLRIR